MALFPNCTHEFTGIASGFARSVFLQVIFGRLLSTVIVQLDLQAHVRASYLMPCVLNVYPGRWPRGYQKKTKIK
jgi:hypothetical protein